MQIQRCFKAYQRKMFWHRWVVKSRSARKIQAMVRGTLSRHLVRLWLKRRWYLITQVQAAYRAIVSRRATVLKYKWENPAVLDIQRVFRGCVALAFAPVRCSGVASLPGTERWQVSIAEAGVVLACVQVRGQDPGVVARVCGARRAGPSVAGQHCASLHRPRVSAQSSPSLTRNVVCRRSSFKHTSSGTWRSSTFAAHSVSPTTQLRRFNACSVAREYVGSP